jgi:hypothetical protein
VRDDAVNWWDLDRDDSSDGGETKYDDDIECDNVQLAGSDDTADYDTRDDADYVTPDEEEEIQAAEEPRQPPGRTAAPSAAEATADLLDYTRAAFGLASPADEPRLDGCYPACINPRNGLHWHGCPNRAKAAGPVVVEPPIAAEPPSRNLGMGHEPMQTYEPVDMDGAGIRLPTGVLFNTVGGENIAGIIGPARLIPSLVRTIEREIAEHWRRVATSEAAEEPRQPPGRTAADQGADMLEEAEAQDELDEEQERLLQVGLMRDGNMHEETEEPEPDLVWRDEEAEAEADCEQEPEPTAD